MGRKSTIALYVLYTLAAVAVSLYVRFPSETVRDYMVRQSDRLAPGLDLAVADIRPALPATIEFRDIEARYRSRSLLELKQVRLSPVWASLLRLDPAIAFATSAGGGELSGIAFWPKNKETEKPTFRVAFDRIQLAKLPTLPELLGRRISGILSGTASGAAISASGGIEVAFRISDATIPLLRPILQQDQVSFRQIETQAALIGRRLQIDKCEFRGASFDGQMTGRIELDPALGASNIQLAGTVKPHTVLMAEIKKIVPERLIPRPGPGGAYPVQLTGSLKNPRYSIQ